MNRTGTIVLYNCSHSIIKQKVYYTMIGRASIISSFKELYNPDGYYHIIPLLTSRSKDVIPDAPKEKIVRPPSEYSNLKPYQYK